MGFHQSERVGQCANASKQAEALAGIRGEIVLEAHPVNAGRRPAIKVDGD